MVTVCTFISIIVGIGLFVALAACENATRRRRSGEVVPRIWEVANGRSIVVVVRVLVVIGSCFVERRRVVIGWGFEAELLSDG